MHNRRAIVTLTAVVVVAVAAVLMGGAIFSVFRARGLRDEICKLELGKSTFADVNVLSNKYKGYFLRSSTDAVQCSPQSCNFVLYVDNPTKMPLIGRKTGFVALIVISDNVVRSRYVAISSKKQNEAMEVFVEQSSDSNFAGGPRILRTAVIPRIGAQVSADASPTFVQLATSLDLGCLARPNGCFKPDKILPFLKGSHSDDQ